MRFAKWCSAILACVVLATVVGLKNSDPPGVRMKTFADSFLSSLDEEQKKKAANKRKSRYED